jgi:hypothetical protein
MERQRVSSSDLSSIGYDISSQTLEIEFNSGAIYDYFNVPPPIYQGLMSAQSHGRYFNAYIKDRYQCQRIA